MKLQISFDTTDLEKTIATAHKLTPYADIFEVGTLLIYLHGITALERFRKEFSNTTILADTKIVDRGKTIVKHIASTNVDWLTVMAGTSKNVVHAATRQAHNKGIKVMLDLLDANSLGQSALEAKNLGADALLFHQPYEQEEASDTFFDSWEMIRGNTQLPIFVSGRIDRDTVHEIIKLNPDGIVVGNTITEADDPAAQADYFHSLLTQ